LKKLEIFIIKSIEFFNYIYQNVSYDAGKVIWFRNLPLSARLICFFECIDEDFLYKLHLCGIEWNLLIFEILRHGFPLSLFLNILKQEYIILFTMALNQKKINSAFLEEQCLISAYHSTKKFLCLNNSPLFAKNFIETRVISIFLRLRELDDDEYTMFFGTDPMLRRFWTLSYIINFTKL